MQLVMTDELQRVINSKKAEATAAANEARLSEEARAALPAPPSVPLIRTLSPLVNPLVIWKCDSLGVRW